MVLQQVAREGFAGHDKEVGEVLDVERPEGEKVALFTPEQSPVAVNVEVSVLAYIVGLNGRRSWKSNKSKVSETALTEQKHELAVQLAVVHLRAQTVDLSGAILQVEHPVASAWKRHEEGVRQARDVNVRVLRLHNVRELQEVSAVWVVRSGLDRRLGSSIQVELRTQRYLRLAR